jgi:uncharacterized protein (TIGR02145 family)
MVHILKRNYGLFSLAFKVIAVLSILFLLHSCSKDKCGEYNPATHFFFTLDGELYKFAKIGDFLWMAENLNYNTGDSLNSLCYDNDYSNCEKYGRLYDWDAAMKVCPDGWHLPTASEWDDLIRIAGGDEAGSKLKAKTGWDDFEDWRNFIMNASGNGTDDFGFSALPGGYSYSNMSEFAEMSKFDKINRGGSWWSAIESRPNKIYAVEMASYWKRVDIYGYADKSIGFSVRCIKRDYAQDSIAAMQIEEKSKEISSFKDYESNLDILLKDRYKTMLDWCNAMEYSYLKKYYLEKSLKEDYFLKYYDERCVKPAKEFELLVTNVNYEKGSYGGYDDISIKKTEIGAHAKYKTHINRYAPSTFMLRLYPEEWQDFIRALYKLGVTEWKGDGTSLSSRNMAYWNLTILFSGKDSIYIDSKMISRLPNKYEFEKIIGDMMIKVETRRREGG